MQTKHGNWHCKMCEDGWWQEDADHRGCMNTCDADMDHCDKCSGDGETCLRCKDGYIVNSSNDGCVEAIQFCHMTAVGHGQPSGLSVAADGSYICDECMPGHFWDGDCCADCHVEHCLECSEPGTCTKCALGRIPSFNKRTCIP